MGVSKHYILNTRIGTFVDYQIPEVLIEQLPPYARHEIAFRDNLLGMPPGSWRKRIQNMWRDHPPLNGDMVLREFLVYPGRSARSCAWRAEVQKIRKFLKSKPARRAQLQQGGIQDIAVFNPLINRLVDFQLGHLPLPAFVNQPPGRQ